MTNSVILLKLLVALSAIIFSSVSLAEDRLLPVFVYVEKNKEENLCFLSIFKGNVFERFAGTYTEEKNENEQIIKCEIISSEKFRENHSYCFMNGLKVDGLDYDNSNSVVGWSCSIDRGISSLSIHLKKNAKRGVVICSGYCKIK